jgi:hypothetical protein
MLAGMVAEARTHVQPTEAEPYLRRCRAAIAAFPMMIQTPSGAWLGRDTKVPEPAIKLLHPNGEPLSRDYLNDETKQMVSLLIVNCKDARYLEGHYPPRCYPAQGEVEIKAETRPRTWRLAHIELTGMEYHFAPKSPTDQGQVVYNFFVMPRIPDLTVSHKELDGVICPDTHGVDKSGEDYQRRYYGAAEFQLVTAPQMSPQERDRALIDLLSPNEKLIWTLENRPDAGGN